MQCIPRFVGPMAERSVTHITDHSDQQLCGVPKKSLIVACQQKNLCMFSCFTDGNRIVPENGYVRFDPFLKSLVMGHTEFLQEVLLLDVRQHWWHMPVATQHVGDSTCACVISYACDWSNAGGYPVTAIVAKSNRKRTLSSGVPWCHQGVVPNSPGWSKQTISDMAGIRQACPGCAQNS